MGRGARARMNKAGLMQKMSIHGLHDVLTKSHSFTLSEKKLMYCAFRKQILLILLFKILNLLQYAIKDEQFSINIKTPPYLSF